MLMTLVFIIPHINPWLANIFYSLLFLFLKKIYCLFIFRKRGREGQREGGKHQCVVASHMPHTGALALNPGICPSWELNWLPLGLQASAQSTEPHQPGLYAMFYLKVLKMGLIPIKDSS